jgi:N-acetylmuramoyl-L-alanine amidase
MTNTSPAFATAARCRPAVSAKLGHFGPKARFWGLFLGDDGAVGAARAESLGASAVAAVLAVALTAGICQTAAAAGHVPVPQGSDPSSASGQEPETRSPEARPPLDGWVIGLDPGHSGSYSAKRGTVPDGRGGRKACNTSGTATAKGYPEHRFTFDVARRTAKLLRAKGATVRLTRSDDSRPGPCVDKRGTFPQRSGVDAMVSLHGDGSSDTSLRGYHAIVSSPPLNRAQGAPSVALAKAIMAELSKAGFDRNPNYRGGLSKRSDIAGVNLSERPTVMMELGEMRNPDEAKTMSSAAGRQRYAQAITRGVVAWAARHEPGTWDDAEHG